MPNTVNELTKTIREFLKTTAIQVVLTYPFLTEKIAFPCRLKMTNDEIAARVAFYTQPDDAIEAGKHKYNVDMLCSLLDGPPVGLPAFEQFAQAIANEDRGPIEAGTKPGDMPVTLAVYKKALAAYLLAETDPDSFGVKLANDAIEAYNRTTEPKEFFR
jgi:hypothetical protein